MICYFISLNGYMCHCFQAIIMMLYIALPKKNTSIKSLLISQWCSLIMHFWLCTFMLQHSIVITFFFLIYTTQELKAEYHHNFFKWQQIVQKCDQKLNKRTDGEKCTIIIEKGLYRISEERKQLSNHNNLVARHEIYTQTLTNTGIIQGVEVVRSNGTK